jgi:hypothetical protein
MVIGVLTGASAGQIAGDLGVLLLIIALLAAPPFVLLEWRKRKHGRASSDAEETPPPLNPKGKKLPGDRRGDQARLDELWKEQDRWRWRPVVPAVIVGVGAIAMPRPWQTSVATGWFYGLGILTLAYLTAIWMKKWFAY